MIRAVIFDMDGVLTDSEPLINAAAIAMFAEKGLQVRPEDFVPFIGAGEDRYIGGVAEKYGFALNLPEAKRRTYELYLQLVPSRLQAYPGATALVEQCRRAGLKVAVASSADRVKIAANLDKIGLPAETWDAVITGEDVVPKKPAPDIFLAAAARLGARPEECVVVEDAVNGVAAAKAAQMRCVAVAQTFPAEELSAADLVRPGIASVSVGDLTGRAPDTAIPTTASDQTAPPLLGQPLSAAPPVIPPPLPATAAPVSKPWGFWATVGLGAAIFVVYIIAQAIPVAGYVGVRQAMHGGPLPEHLERNGFLLSLSVFAGAPVMFLMAGLFARLRTPDLKEYFGLRMPHWTALLGWPIVLFVFLAGSDLLTHLLGKPIVPPFMVEAWKSAGVKPLFCLAIIVVAPLTEETLFRGFLYQGIAHSKAGVPTAILLPTLAWASIHLQYDIYGMVSIFVAGCVLGMARYKTGSIIVPIYLHALMNLVATVETALTA